MPRLQSVLITDTYVWMGPTDVQEDFDKLFMQECMVDARELFHRFTCKRAGRLCSSCSVLPQGEGD